MTASSAARRRLAELGLRWPPTAVDREGDAIAAAPATAALAQDNGEWKDTEIHFEITARDGKTEIGFPHAGLVPDYECFDVCSNSWGFYLYTSLRALIRTGHGLPNRKEQVAFA
jgi:hypothetical protein